MKASYTIAALAATAAASPIEKREAGGVGASSKHMYEY